MLIDLFVKEQQLIGYLHGEDQALQTALGLDIMCVLDTTPYREKSWLSSSEQKHNL